MFVEVAPLVAALVPVGPAAAWRADAAPDVALNEPCVEDRSQRSVIPPGGVSVVAGPIPKNPTSIVFALVVVIDGAVIVLEDAFTWPPWASIGVVVETPDQAVIPPAAAWELANVQVYEVGSEAVATL